MFCPLVSMQLMALKSLSKFNLVSAVFCTADTPRILTDDYKMKKYSNPKMEFIEVCTLMEGFDPSPYKDPDTSGDIPTAPIRNW